MRDSAVIVLNGKLIAGSNEYKKLIDFEDRIVIGVDGGSLLLEEIGFLPELIIGDLDSLTKYKIKEYKLKGIKIIEYPREKDETDGELAVDYCLSNHINDLIITASLGGRFDQQLANVFLLEYASKQGINAIIKEPGIEIGIVKGKKKFNDKKGMGLSLLPLSRQVTDVDISGCKYKLDKARLIRYKTRGISNLIESESASVRIKNGVLVYILRNNT
ncbi:thiamine diphosphokinase [Iocasia frigidifontis]|uniref:Thiamine diphosphokinase n=1 Tax=Iocasia fonsfrigidae TaxID=2682810 RepID=A0A8A7KEQ7_9FIRM|nr:MULTISPECIES: thiamine diphosphokinase [Halanaerobiaceae]AZO95222.1 thiamine diphosphokinase [Halocella sp. SP3-1]QTL98158.1 thiamine diphosphokinase [Iocasia fonsfrigidae]